MSTRGAIAVLTGDSWQGRYHHFASYPAGLGRTLFRLYHQTFGRDHAAMATTLVEQHPAGWSTIINPAGPHPFTVPDFDHSGFAEPDSSDHARFPACYCHGSRNDSAQLLVCRCPGNTEGCLPLWIEWVYVLTPTGMQVLTSHHPDSDREAAHRLVAWVPWQQEEPYWQHLHQRVDTARIPALGT
ncbi:hypothetical protein [Salinactinospora qingdaonensis]|uniref:Uncharacterized protein n=1 Tax=Salinactinospora qingdaonensis TaxID=702744 RepID=A0ABP7FQ20_9ACTN